MIHKFTKLFQQSWITSIGLSATLHGLAGALLIFDFASIQPKFTEPIAVNVIFSSPSPGGGEEKAGTDLGTISVDAPSSSKKSRNIEENNFYQLMRTIIGKIVNFIVRYSFSISIRDTQAGLKGFIKPQDFSKLKFSSKRFFFDLELLLYFISKKKKIFSIPVFFKVPDESNINFFDLKKNFEVIKELLSICINKNVYK